MRDAAASPLEMAAGRSRDDLSEDDVDLDIGWTTVSEDLPAIIPALEAVLAGCGQ